MRESLVFLAVALVLAGVVVWSHRPTKPVTTAWTFRGRASLMQGGFIETWHRMELGNALVKREWYDDDGKHLRTEGPASWLPAIDIGVIHGDPHGKDPKGPKVPPKKTPDPLDNDAPPDAA